jgi:transposase
MKKYGLFIGVDISKNWIDVSLTLDGKKASMLHRRFANREKSFTRMHKWLNTFSKEHGFGAEQWLFCMEHTGVYTLPLSFIWKNKATTMWSNQLFRLSAVLA